MLNRIPVRFALPTRAASLMIAMFLGLGLVIAPGADRADAAISARTGTYAVKHAAAQVGVKYRLGGTSRSTGFDCSGLTRYAFGRVGKRLPRTAQQQYQASYKIAAKYRRAGDLVFFYTGNSIWHVGIYAGNGYMWHAPKPGKRVAKVKIWTSQVKYGRVR